MSFSEKIITKASNRIAAISRALLVATLVMVPVVGFISVPLASAEEQKKPQERKTKRAQALTLSIGKAVTNIQKAIGEEDFDKALAGLDDVKRKITAKPDKFKDYDRATIWNLYAYIYQVKEDFANAEKAFRTILNLKELESGTRKLALQGMARLSFIKEDYRGAIKFTKEWLSLEDEPDPSSYYILAQAYYQIEEFDNTVKYIEQAIALAKQRQLTVKESWYQLLVGVHFEKENFQKAFDALKELLKKYPKVRYYQQLAFIYFQLDKDFEYYSMTVALNDDSNLNDGKKMLGFAQALLQYERPYHAAIMLDKGMKEKKIEETENNLKLLANAWVLSKEYEKAIEPLAKSAKLAETGAGYIVLANAYLNIDKLKEAAKAAQDGIKKGKLKRPGEAYMMLGRVHFSLEDYRKAIRAFNQAKKHKKVKKAAIKWVSHVKNAQKRDEDIRNRLKALGLSV